MNKTYYVCKYTPIELLESLGGECENFNHMPEDLTWPIRFHIPISAVLEKHFWKESWRGKSRNLSW